MTEPHPEGAAVGPALARPHDLDRAPRRLLGSPAAGSACGRRPSTQWGMLRLTTVGRQTGKERVAIVGYIEDGPNLVMPAMNGWADPEPAWWLNLQANPEAVVELPGGVAPGGRARRGRRGARAPVGEVRRAGVVGLHRRERRAPITRDRARDLRASRAAK